MVKLNDKRFLYGILIVIPMLNFLFMHYYFYINNYLEWTEKYSEIVNICGIVFDVSVLMFFSLLITKGQLKPALVVTQIITIIWSFVNVVYVRFFYQYMSLSAIGEAHGLGDGLVINSVMSAFCLYDSFYLLSVFSFFTVFKLVKPYKLSNKTVLRLLSISVLSVMITIFVYSVYHFLNPHYRNNWELYKFRLHEFLYDPVRGGTPNLVHFQTGCIRVAIYEIYDLFHSKELTSDQKKQIEDYYQDHSFRTTHYQRNPKIKNVVFILLESFLSAPIDLKVDGKEVTPFLNSLKRDSDVYYNGNMISDIGIGESGDGQFIYMTGILPLKYKMTVGLVKSHILPSLPKVLCKELGLQTSEIIIPTMPSMWQQTDMNIAYGITKSYSMIDIIGDKDGDVDDQSIFEFAAKSLNMNSAPFFSLILSFSGHGPYDHYKGENLFLGKNDYPEEYLNYLNTCHYTDAQIEKYFNVLKSKGLYENTLIVIASDHYAHLDRLKMSGKVSPHIPLFIINGGICEKELWKGEFHQLDTYTTLIDLLSTNQTWKGLGYTLLYPMYSNSVTDYSYDVSRMIIEGDYFKESGFDNF